MSNESALSEVTARKMLKWDKIFYLLDAKASSRFTLASNML
jgi:hypothetical protein